MKQQILKLYLKGYTQAQIAKKFGVSQSYVSRVCPRRMTQVNVLELLKLASRKRR